MPAMSFLARSGAPRTTVRRVGPVGALLLAVVLLASACQIDWQQNKNFGVVIEPGAARASMAIYRAPRKLLYTIYQQKGIRPVQDIIYASGNGPLTKMSGFCVANACYQSGFLRDEFHELVYGRTGDLTEALVNAQQSLDCLDLTIISGGLYTPNWTHKSVGCIIGEV